MQDKNAKLFVMQAGRVGSTGSEQIAGDELAEGDDIIISLDFKANHADTAAEEEVELAVEIEGAGSFHRIGLQLVVGECGEIHLFTGDTLHIHGNHAFIRKNNRIADGLESCDNELTLHQEGADAVHLAFGAYRGKFEQASVFKINHGVILNVVMTSLLQWFSKSSPENRAADCTPRVSQRFCRE